MQIQRAFRRKLEVRDALSLNVREEVPIRDLRWWAVQKITTRMPAVRTPEPIAKAAVVTQRISS